MDESYGDKYLLLVNKRLQQHIGIVQAANVSQGGPFYRDTEAGQARGYAPTPLEQPYTAKMFSGGTSGWKR